MSSDASVREPARPRLGLGRPCARAERLPDRCRHRFQRANGRRASRSTDRPRSTHLRGAVGAGGRSRDRKTEGCDYLTSAASTSVDRVIPNPARLTPFLSLGDGLSGTLSRLTQFDVAE
eukprot:1895803-Prymnesium_polylepis.1